MAQLFLLMMARANPLISILERGDSYRPLGELMGGRSIDVDLEGAETIDPWDLPPGQTAPGKERIAFLKNLTLQMIGDSPSSDRTLLDNLLSDAIARAACRPRIRDRERNAIHTYFSKNPGRNLSKSLTTWPIFSLGLFPALPVYVIDINCLKRLGFVWLCWPLSVPSRIRDRERKAIHTYFSKIGAKTAVSYGFHG